MIAIPTQYAMDLQPVALRDDAAFDRASQRIARIKRAMVASRIREDAAREAMRAEDGWERHRNWDVAIAERERQDHLREELIIAYRVLLETGAPEWQVLAVINPSLRIGSTDSSTDTTTR